MHRAAPAGGGRRTAAGLEALEDLNHPVRALPARRALAAGLVRVELRPAKYRADDAGRLVEDLQRLGAEHRPRRTDGLVVECDIEVLGGEDRRRRAAWRPELQPVAFAHTAGEVQQLAQRHPEWRLVLSGFGHVARQRVEREARRLLTAEPAEPVDALVDDRRHAGDRLDVVDDGRAGIEAGDGGERRSQAWLAAEALERVEQCRLLAADVGTRAGVDDDVERVARAQDLASEDAGLVGI